ncbi:L-fuculose-phosphate aldolase [Collinsella sp. AGMB00827]|uniref:L-fuculose-phosphate aldolase n=1 Tax=Collinsella ureilytica TaxID=2869515 RepID=A0ABS7MHS2_9ACTN|nr:L-fuculose-phosphate aldolase [Collinsella urealyticum]MBY4796908.1 L-fuculose-phosphate aldolase [Collinsella urealyticum]
MFIESYRAQLIAFGKRLVDSGLTKGTGGNLSIFDREHNQMAITPSGIDFFEIREEDIVIVGADGQVVEGSRTPSSEWQMHLETYLARPDIDAVIHAHTTYATALAIARIPLRATHYMVAVAGSDVRVAEYATYGTPELAHNAVKAMEGRRAVLLANHGILAGAADLLNAFNIVEEVEYCAKVFCIAKSVGDPVVLDGEEMARMAEKFKTYGQRTTRK